jgi:hypothetical protein
MPATLESKYWLIRLKGEWEPKLLRVEIAGKMRVCFDQDGQEIPKEAIDRWLFEAPKE